MNNGLAASTGYIYTYAQNSSRKGQVRLYAAAVHVLTSLITELKSYCYTG